MRVVFIHGPAASGKHTIGSLLSTRTGLPLFHNHLAVDLARTLFEFGSEGFTQLRAKVWIAAFSEAAAAGTSFIFTFHPEATVDPSLIGALVQIVESSGGKVCFVELRANRETVLRRLGNASRARFGKLMDPKLYQQIELDGGFDFPALPTPLLVIDTDATKAEDAAVAIEQALSRVA
jgi:hypothetical protein